MKWIAVKKRLPKCGRVKDGDLGWLVYRPKSKRKIWIETAHPDWWATDKGTSQEITHWMPLPKRPAHED